MDEVVVEGGDGAQLDNATVGSWTMGHWWLDQCFL